MSEDSIEQTITQVARQRGEFRPEAYFFTVEALNQTVHELTIRRHLSGPELLRGIVRLAYERFGSEASEILEGWGIDVTRDFGVIVYDLIEAGVLSHSDSDSIEDFEDVFDLSEAISEEAWRQRWRLGGADAGDPFDGAGIL